jgi:serine/threonine protein kinase
MAASQGQHAQVIPGMLVQNRYVVIKEIGCGNFSKVYTCKDTKAPSYCAARPENTPTLALKVLKREYANDAAFERDMLKVLANKDPDNNYHVSKMLDMFHWNRHPCFVMPLKGPTLRTRKLGMSKGHVSRSDMVRIARSLLKSLKFVHFDCKMVHTDLKPENILLNADAAHLGDGWTICDFGSASHWRVDRMDSDLISTRPYRAPEVVLGNPWSFPADIWSIGCILYEVAVGSRLFEVHDDNTHLHLMTHRLGSLPEVYTRRSKHSKKYFDAHGALLRPSAGATTSASKSSVADTLRDEPLLLDLLQAMLHYDPAKRIRADVALEHPFFDSTSSSSCGTSAAQSSTSTPRGVDAKTVASRSTSQEPTIRSSTTTTTASTIISSGPASSKFRALPPLMNAFQALGVSDGPSPPLTAKENLTEATLKRKSPSSAAADRPVQGKCRTPEELRKAPLSAHVTSGVGRKLSFQTGAVANKLTPKPLATGLPRSASSNNIAPRPTAALPAAGKSSGLRYFGH